jgi:LmbE family N-acetylglucosaminyl deacetylase
MDDCEPLDRWRPVLLPRPDREPAGADIAVLAECRGERPLKSFGAADRARIERARHDGLVALAPPGHTDTGARVLVISPHPDDAVLSLGATLASARGMIVDVFSHETWSPRRFYAERPGLTASTILDEERTSCLILGAEPVFLNFPDAPLRGIGPFSADTLGDLVPAVADALREVVGDHHTIHAPLGIGGHVDHLICHRATMLLVQDGTIALHRLRFYEDLPYAAFSHHSPAPTTGSPLTAEIRVASASETLAKTEAIRAYHVQLRTGMRSRVLAYGKALGKRGLLAERIWRYERVWRYERDGPDQPVTNPGDRDNLCSRPNAEQSLPP